MALEEKKFDEYIQQILDAVYGEEVRGSIVGALEYANAGLSVLAQLPASSSIVSVDQYVDMTEPEKVYLYTGTEQDQYPGYWYYHNGTAFVPGAEFDPTAGGSFWFYARIRKGEKNENRGRGLFSREFRTQNDIPIFWRLWRSFA